MFDQHSSPPDESGIELAVAVERLRAAERTIATLTVTVDSLRHELDIVKRQSADECDAMSVTLASTHSQIAALEEACAALRTEAAEATVAHQAIRSQPDTLRSDLAEARASISRLESALAEAEAAKSSAESSASAAANRLLTLEGNAHAAREAELAAEVRADRAESALMSARMAFDAQLAELHRNRPEGGAVPSPDSIVVDVDSISASILPSREGGIGERGWLQRFRIGLVMLLVIAARFATSVVSAITSAWRGRSSSGFRGVREGSSSSADRTIVIAVGVGFVFGLAMSGLLSGGSSAAQW